MRFHSLLLAAALSGLSTTPEAQIPPTPVTPVAIAGAFQTTDAGSWVGLDGRQSYNPGGGPLTYRWTQTGGPSVVLYDDNQPTAYFRTDSSAPATYIIRLRVTNAQGQVDGSGLKVTVTPNVTEFTGNQDSLAPYNVFGTLTRREAQHLARRVAYDMTPAEIETIRQNGLVPTIQALMTTPTPQAVLDGAVAYFTEPTQCSSIMPPVYWGTQKQNQHYLLHLFLNDRDSVLKWRLFYFWHDRFATSTKGIRPVIRHFRHMHSSMIERNVFGNSHHTFLEELTTDGAMMDWLNIFDSTAAAPNENYMRELMELFAIGLDQYIPGTPNFTELDVQNGAKALTGYVFDLTPSPPICVDRNGPLPGFDINNHDTGNHPLFENYPSGTVTDVSTVVRACLAHPAASRYAATNLFKYFVGFEPSTTVIDVLAADIVNDGWNLQPTIEKILVSSAMFSPEARKAKVATPLDFCLGAVRKFEFPYAVPDVRDRLEELGQSLLDPPSVKGWPDDESWVGQQAMVDRMVFINELLTIATDATNLPNLPSKIAPFLPADPNLNDAASYVQSLFRALDIDNEELNSALFTRLMSFMNTDPATGNNDRFDTTSLDHLHSRGTGAIYHGYTLSIGIHN